MAGLWRMGERRTDPSLRTTERKNREKGPKEETQRVRENGKAIPQRNCFSGIVSEWRLLKLLFLDLSLGSSSTPMRLVHW